MTTAHRPTWNSVRGGSEQGGNVLIVPKRNYSALDLPAHLQLKTRQEGQGTKEEQSLIDFREELRREEIELAKKKRGATVQLEDEPATKRFKLLTGSASALKTPFPQDADERFSDDDEESKSKESDSEEEEESEDDDELELLREYQKIKREREEEQKRKEAEKLEELKRRQRDDILTANPLLN